MANAGFRDVIRSIPPVTRFLCGSSLAVTLPTMLQILSLSRLVLVWPLVIRRFELWRVWTTFFYGGTGLGYLFELVMLYRSSASLELDHYPWKSPDYAWQLTLAAGAILAANLPLGTYLHSRALTLCILYLSSALAPAGTQTSFMGLITFPIEYLPHVMIGIDFLMGGPGAALISVTGAVVGHLWWWILYGQDQRFRRLREFGRAPSWVHALVSRGTGANFGTGVQATPPRGQGEGTDRTAGYNWGGGGNRLGSR